MMLAGALAILAGVSMIFLTPACKCRDGTLITPQQLPSKTLAIRNSPVILQIDATQSELLTES